MANIFGYVRESINEGDGLRAVIFFSGCHGLCEECHNPESWDFNYGVPFSHSLQQKIMEEIIENPLLDGVTYCGGEPFLSAGEILEFTTKLKNKKPELTFWSYTGFTFEELKENPKFYRLLKKMDVVIDGPFIKEKKDLSLKFRGSSNQRIIDVQQSLRGSNIVFWEKGEKI